MGDWPKPGPHVAKASRRQAGAVSAHSQTDVLAAGVRASGKVGGAAAADSQGDPDPNVTHPQPTGSA